MTAKQADPYGSRQDPRGIQGAIAVFLGKVASDGTVSLIFPPFIPAAPENGEIVRQGDGVTHRASGEQRRYCYYPPNYRIGH